MEKRVLIDTWQKVVRDDFLKFGTFPQQSFDTLVGKVLIPDLAYDGFAVVQSGPAEVQVANGHLFSLGKVYVNDTEGGTTVDLLSRTPAATKKICTIVAWGTETDAKLEARTFLTDAETRATVARETATEHWRWANIGVVAGQESPDPLAPALEANVCPIAYVTLTTTGIASIVMDTDFQVPTLREADNRLNAFDIWKAVIGTRLDTLAADLLALAARILGTAKFEYVRKLAADLARVKDIIRVDTTATAWDCDHFVTQDGSDTQHVDYLARVEEGVRFPAAATSDSQLGLLNPYDELVINSSDMLLPKWTSTIALSEAYFDNYISISQYQYQTVEFVQKTMSIQRTRYGTVFNACTNSQFVQQGTLASDTETFYYGGSTFQVLGYDYALVDGQLYRTSMRAQQVWVDTVELPYWERQVTNYSVSGAVIAQTFVNSQDHWLTQIDLHFSAVAASGDVTVLITETTNGAPAVDKVLAKSTVTAASLKVSGRTDATATKFLFTPTFLKKGRYAIVVATAGNHYAYIGVNRNTASGSLFYSTDGAWFLGSLTQDLCYKTYYAKFANNMTKVQLQNLNLAGGIANIDIHAHAIVPEGCRLVYEIQVAGIWHALDAVDGGPSVVLAGLPPALPFRAVFIGTDSMQPALGVASNSRVECWRPRSDFRHISVIRDAGSAITRIDAEIRLEAWRGAPYHTFVPKLLHGAGYATVRLADVSDGGVPAPDDPDNAVIYHVSWTGMGSIQTFRFRLEGTTDNVLTCYHIAERLDVDS